MKVFSSLLKVFSLLVELMSLGRVPCSGSSITESSYAELESVACSEQFFTAG